MLIVRVALIAALVAAAGCGQLFGTSPALVPVPQATTIMVASAFAPATIPMVQLVTPEHGGQRFFAPSESGSWVFSSQAELTAFLEAQPEPTPVPVQAVPPGHPMPTAATAPPRQLPDAYSTVDFGKYQAIAYVSEPGKTRSARIVGIEEQGDRLLVHTVEWLVSESHRTESPDARYLHVVLIPRSAKQVAFAQPAQVTLTAQVVQPSPQVGDPNPTVPTQIHDPDTQPRWKAVLNPEVTKGTIEAELRRRMGGSPADVSISRLSLEEAAQLQPGGDGGGMVRYFMPGSEVWMVVVTGEGAGRSMHGGDFGTPTREVVMFISIEDGQILMAHGRS